jgi:predicted phage terminase large subunit-like protein
VLMPVQFPAHVVEALKTKPREWSGQYLQDPVPQSGQIFDPAWWRHFKTKEAPEFELITLSVDCSFRATSGSDYVCLQKWGQVGSRSYLLDCRTERLGFAATKAAIKIMQREGRPASAVLIEARANGDAIIEELKSDPDFGAAIVAIEPEGGKESRAHAASVDCEAGNVYIPEDQPWVGAFLRSMSVFPAGRHDDEVDACSQFLNWRRTRSLSLGLVEYLKSLASGARQMVATVRERLRPKSASVSVGTKTPQETRVEGYERLREKPAKCEVCGVVAVGQHPDGHGKTLCRQCGAVDGVLPVDKSDTPEHVHRWRMVPGGFEKCDDCAEQRPIATLAPMTTNGVSRAQYAAMQTLDAKIRRSFGRFG